MNNICEDFKTVAVSYHAGKVINPDWMVSADKLGQYPPFDKGYLSHKVGTRISAHPELSDYEISQVNWWYGSNSATLAFWFSCYIADKVYVCGADLLQSKQAYFHGIDNVSYGRGLDWQLNVWKQAPHVAEKLNTEVIIMSGPLKILFN